jgi:ParB-like chromosome segregation protein Spo0J
MPTNADFKAAIEWRSPASIKPYFRNNKKHLEPAVKKLATQIRQLGWDVPIVVDADGVIIKGHRRHLAAKHLKLAQVPVIARPDLTSEQVRAARLADNRMDEDSDYDCDAIAAELTELDDVGFDLNLTGYDQEEIDVFLSEDEPITDYQPPEPGMGGRSDGGGSSNNGDGKTAEPQSPDAKYPLSIVLTSGEYQRRKAACEKFGVKKDVDLFLKLLELAGF